MSHLQYAQEKAKLVKSGACVIFATDAPPPPTFAPVLLTDLLHFTIYPTCDRHLLANDLLWSLAHKRTCTLSQLSPFLPYSRPCHIPFALAIPPQLARFLTSVTLPEMRAAVIYMLADAAQGEDSAGLEKMQKELPNCVWKKLTALMELTAAQRNAGWGIAEGSSPGITDASFLLDAALQTAPSNDYWKISVDVAYALTQQPLLTQPRITMLSVVEQASKHFNLGCHAEHVHIDPSDATIRWAHVLQSLYEDWRKYAAVCGVCVVPSNAKLADRRRGDTSSDGVYARAQKVLTTLVSSNRQGDTWARIDTLQDCSAQSGSFVSWLPTHIVEQVLVPTVLTVETEEAENEMNCGKAELKPVANEEREVR